MQALGYLGIATLGVVGFLLLRARGGPAKGPPLVPNDDLPDGGYASNPSEAERAKHVAASKVIQEGALKYIGRELTPFELLYTQGVCKYETSYGQGWTGACAGSNNWGSVHAVGSQPSCPWTDSHADNAKYAQPMRVYPTPVDGAGDVVKRVVKNSGVEGALRDPAKATLWRASLTMRRNMYYGSWCLKTVETFGKAAAKTSANRNPQTQGERECEREAVGLHVWRMKKELATIAPSLGIPPIPEGSYEDAISWYEAKS